MSSHHLLASFFVSEKSLKKTHHWACTICSHSLCRAVVFRSTCHVAGHQILWLFWGQKRMALERMPTVWETGSWIVTLNFCKFWTWATRTQYMFIDVLPGQGCILSCRSYSPRLQIIKHKWFDCTCSRYIPSLFIPFPITAMEYHASKFAAIGCNSKFV